MRVLKQISKYSFLFDAGGVLYVLIELAWARLESLDDACFGRPVLYLSRSHQ